MSRAYKNLRLYWFRAYTILDTLLLLLYDKLIPPCGNFMKFLSAKKLILIGFIVVLLIAIPLTVFILQREQQTTTQAEQATTLSFEPNSTAAAPIQASTGQPVSLDVIVDPGIEQNLVSFVRLEVQYDPTKLTPVDESTELFAFEENTGALTLLEGPVIDSEQGLITATLSVGVDPTKVIQTRTRIATINFIATAATDSVPTEVTFTTTSQVLSAGSSDQANENVLASRIPAYVMIIGDTVETEITPTTTGTPEDSSPSATIQPTLSPSPTTIQSSTAATLTPSPTVSNGIGASTNNSPLCENLTADRATTGIAPFSITLNALGSDQDGTIETATFSYGDGQVENITTGGGLGTSSIDLQAAHTYDIPGLYQASVVLTDDDGGVSTSGCILDITVTGEDGVVDDLASNTPTPTPADATLMETGPGDIFLGFGLAISVLTILGGILFFTL